MVGGVGIANVMFVSVLERRSEIGLRRALGATRGHIALQFLAESLFLSSLGGAAGVAGGLGATAAYATLQGWAILIPPLAIWAAFAAAVFIGVVAGLYPALRAARLSPTEALRSA
jgi:putative ABC transport system permease protein